MWAISGDSCLHCAAFFGDVELALMLLSYGAKATFANSSSKAAVARRQVGSAMVAEQLGWKGEGGARRRHVDPQALMELAAWNLPLHYVLLGSSSERMAKRGDPEDEEEALRREQRRLMTLELLLWPKAYIASVAGGEAGAG